jgi:hypothetical protein
MKFLRILFLIIGAVIVTYSQTDKKSILTGTVYDAMARL